MRLTMSHLLLRKNGYYISQFQMVRHLVTDPKYGFLKQLGINDENPGLYDGRWGGSGKLIESISPATGKVIAKVREATPQEVSNAIRETRKALEHWEATPLFDWGNIIREIGDEFSKKLKPLARLISFEIGKILPEAEGEVQEFIDICDCAVDLSHTIHDVMFPSMIMNDSVLEEWNPLGVVGVISSIDYPIAAYGWKGVIPMVCGNTIVWKPASSTPLIAIATTKIIASVFEGNGIPGSIASLITGGSDIGETLVNNKRIPLISFTGSTNVGKQIALKDADLEMAVRAVAFSCVGIAGQRYTTTRRLILHKKIKDEFLGRLKTEYESILERVGDPLDDGVLYGPLHNQSAVDAYKAAIKKAVETGGKIEFGGKQIERAGFYVEPTIISSLPASAEVVQQETFAPIVYIFEANSLRLLDSTTAWNYI